MRAELVDQGKSSTSGSKWALEGAADELLLNYAIDLAERVAADLDCSAEAAREAVLMDEDVLLFWMPNAEAAFAGGATHEAVPDLPSTDPARWFDRFATTGEDRADP